MKRNIVRIGAIGVVVWLCAFRAGAETALPPIESFGNLPLVDSPQFSPDGKHLAAIQSYKGRPAAVIYDLTAPAGTAPKIISDSDHLIYAIAWAKNDRLLVTINENVKAGYDDKIEAWFRTVSFDSNGGNPVLLFNDSTWRDYNHSAAAVVDYDLDDPLNVYMPLWVPTAGDEAQLALYQVDVTTGHSTKAQYGGTNTDAWLMDGHGHVVGRVDETSHPLVDHLKLFDKGDWKEVAHYDATGGQGAGVTGISDDGAAIVQFGSVAATGTNGLTRLDMATMTETMLYANPSYDVDQTLTDPWTGRVIGVAFVDDKEEYTYFDPAMENLQRGLEAAFPGTSVHAVSWDTAKDKLIVQVDSARQPTTHYLLDRTTHQATVFSSSYPDLADSDLGEMKPYPYKARDGLDIHAYLTLPPGKAAKNLPTVIFPHGGPGARDQMQFDWMAAFFANRGYAVLQPNFRGSTGYGVKFEESGYGQWGLKMQDDVTDGVRKLIADGIADPKRICIVGASYGGYAALAGAAFTPELYACAVGFAGVYDIRVFLREKATDYGQDSWLISTWTRYIGDRYGDADKLNAVSPALHADQIRCPVLLLHGAGDTTVRIDQSEMMRDALHDAGKSVDFQKFDSDSHYMILPDTRISVLKATEAFLAKHIGQ